MNNIKKIYKEHLDNYAYAYQKRKILFKRIKKALK